MLVHSYDIFSHSLGMDAVAHAFFVEICIIGDRSTRVPTLVCTCGEGRAFHFVGVVVFILLGWFSGRKFWGWEKGWGKEREGDKGRQVINSFGGRVSIVAPVKYQTSMQRL